MTEKEQALYDKLNEFFDDGKIIITDYAGDQDHFTLEIESTKFTGLNRVAQQKLVFEALGDFATSIHAFQFKLKAI